LGRAISTSTSRLCMVTQKVLMVISSLQKGCSSEVRNPRFALGWTIQLSGALDDWLVGHHRGGRCFPHLRARWSSYISLKSSGETADLGSLSVPWHSSSVDMARQLSASPPPRGAPCPEPAWWLPYDLSGTCSLASLLCETQRGRPQIFHRHFFVFEWFVASEEPSPSGLCDQDKLNMASSNKGTLGNLAWKSYHMLFPGSPQKFSKSYSLSLDGLKLALEPVQVRPCLFPPSTLPSDCLSFPGLWSFKDPPAYSLRALVQATCAIVASICMSLGQSQTSEIFSACI
jgi:hypothetical protein